MTDVDTVVIGSGIGGLTAALALARAGERVLVVEQHYLPGGWCHSFDLEGYTFSPGVHYIGDLAPGGRLRAVFEGLGVANELPFLELNPDGFDHVRIDQPGGAPFTFDIPRGKDRFAERLAARFPRDADGIRRFLDLLAAMSRELAGGLRVDGVKSALTLPFKIPTLARYGLRPLSSMVQRFVSDPLARAVLTVQAGDHGMPPSRCPTALHAAVVAHYFDGGYYPKGGARSLPKAFVRALKRHGGEIRVRARVDRILVEGGRALGVRLADGTEIRARRVVSNADPHATFSCVAPEHLPRRVARALDRTPYSISAISLFLAAEVDPRSLGLDSGNVWSLTSPDVEETYRYAADPDPLARGPVPGAFLTTTTCKDPGKRRDGVATFESFTFVSSAAFDRFARSEHGDREPGYEALKGALADRILDRIDTIAPGLRERLVFQAVGTPLTNRFYVGSTRGNLYGIEKNTRQIGPFGYPIRTGIDGLFMCGASTLGHGVAGASFSGLAVARAALGVSTSELLTATGQSLSISPCEPAREAALHVA
ncbi:MAG: NAD(P)/FAD-dependent oxidoreductase [Myxococcota bacterium]